MKSPTTETRLPAARPLTILICGASGMMGKVLVLSLKARGHTVIRLVRRAARAPDEIEWNPEEGKLVFMPGASFDAAINLSGANVGEGRWTEARKAVLLNSRIQATRTLVEGLMTLPRPPEVLVSASAIGYYGSRGDEWLSEESEEGTGFLAEVCLGWEAEALAAERRRVRVVLLRTGMVLAPSEGALSKLLPVFRLGLGGRLGNGKQWMSWITVDDVVEIVIRACTDQRIRGPINAVAPQTVTNAEFTRTLGKVLHRPTIMIVPGFALRAAVGQMADEALLASARIKPTRLLELNFEYKYPELAPSLSAMLKRKNR